MVLFLGAMVIYGGYVLGTFGWSQVKGCQAGLADFVFPGRTPTDNCGASWEAAALASKAAYDAQYKDVGSGNLPSTYPDLPPKPGLTPKGTGPGAWVNGV